jgi:lysozyme
MKLSDAGLDFIKQHEGYRSEAYQDSAGVWTIGFGTTEGVHPGMTVNRDEAEQMLADDVEWAEAAVNDLVRRDLGQRQFDALVSFVYNLGKPNFRSSTLLQEVNAGNEAYVAREFVRWVHAGGRPLKGLARRRVAEADMYLQD